MEFFGSDQDIDFRDRPCISILSRFFEVRHSTMARPIWFKLGTMFNYKLNSRSTVEFFGSDQDIDFRDQPCISILSRFLEVHYSMTASPIWFKLGMIFNYELNSRSMVEFFGSDQFIDQDIDFCDRPCISMSVTLFRSSPFNDGAMDSDQTWNDGYL